MRTKQTRIIRLLFSFLFLSSCGSLTETEIGSSSQLEAPTPDYEGADAIIAPTAVISSDESESIIENSETVVLEMWHPFSGRDAEALNQQIAAFNEELDGGMQIIVTSHADDEVLIEDLLQSIAEDVRPDIVLAPGYFLRDLAENEELVFIENMQLNQGGGNEQSPVFPVFWNLDVMDEKRYGVPYLQLGHFLYYHTAWAEEMGFNAFPDTIGAFEEQICAAFNQNRFDEDIDNNGTGGYFFPSGSVPFLSWMRAFGGSVSFNSRGELIILSDENIQALRYLSRLWNQDCAWWSDKSQTPTQYFLNRNTIVYSGRSDAMDLQFAVMNALEGQGDWNVIPYPSLDGKSILAFDSYSFAIMDREDTDIEEALILIQWMLEPERHLEMVYQNGAFPLSTDEIQIVDREWELYPIWQGTLQYIPFLEPLPQSSGWYTTEKVLDDLGWQIIQYAVTEEDIPRFLEDAESLANSIMLNVPED